MRLGKMLRSGDVILARIQFTDTFEVKIRPVVVLFEELDNIVVAGVTSNMNMKGIPLTKKEGAIEESIIKMNYIFTISKMLVHKTLFHLSSEKKKVIYDELLKFLDNLRN
ncbi:MAG TPA: type II toxin-antitoxin system PemK/MazF family toxin [Nanoarchaeota archaeon]|nr:type II toxin-antitoxin system PemK/MazF family toxin [Nanoarchaeota archaeon]